MYNGERGVSYVAAGTDNVSASCPLRIRLNNVNGKGHVTMSFPTGDVFIRPFEPAGQSNGIARNCSEAGGALAIEYFQLLRSMLNLVFVKQAAL